MDGHLRPTLLGRLNLVHKYSIAVTRPALTHRSKGQGHTVTKTVTVAWLLVTRAAAAYADVGAHVDSTAYVFQLFPFPLVQ